MKRMFWNAAMLHELGRLLPVVASLAFVATVGTARSQSENKPFVDLWVTDQHLQADNQHLQDGANFGFSGGAGPLRGFTDGKDDLVLSAPLEANQVAGAGALYLYENENLKAPTLKPSRLTPTPPEYLNMNLGLRSVVVGNVRGEDALGNPRDNLIFASCYLRNDDYGAACGPAVVVGGSVEMYNWNASGSPQKSLLPPLNPTSATSPIPDCSSVGLSCPDSKPVEVSGFGHGIAVGDVSGDGVPDLVVGAPSTDVEVARDSLGRTYVLAGQGNFYDDPYQTWVGLNAPERGPNPSSANSGTHFGIMVAVAHLDADAEGEVIVGRPDRFGHATPCPQGESPPCDEPQGGSAYVFRGMYLHELLYSLPYDPITNPCGTRNRVIDPPAPDELNEALPEYQLLRNPFGDFQEVGPRPNEPRWYDWFGYLVWNAGDVGSPNGGPPDWVDDIVIHSEDTDYIGDTNDPNNPQKPNCGGQFVYYGVGEEGVDLVHPEHVLLQRPANVGLPETGARIGRMFARLDAWRNSTTGQLEPGLLMAETDATWGGKAHAGIVYLIRLPLPDQPPDPWNAAPIANAWGSNGPLTEPLSTDPDD